MDRASRWRLLYIDDDAEACSQIKELLEGESVSGKDEFPDVETVCDFGEALSLVEARRIDLLLLDVRVGPHDQAVGEEAGTGLLDAIRQRRFVPVVFYTGLPRLVRHLETPLVKVVEKAAGAQVLLQAVRDLFATGLPAVNRALLRHLESVQRDYMWGFVVENWAQFRDTPNPSDLAYLLARRLALHLSGPGVKSLAQELGDETGGPITSGRVHPMQYYVIPPVATDMVAGDLLRSDVGGGQEYWVLLTPSCDLVTDHIKADRALLAACAMLSIQPEFTGWRNELPTPSKGLKDNLARLLSNNRAGQRERFFYLPGALGIPDLVVDFQSLRTAPLGDLAGMERIASLDSPFAETLMLRFVRYFGRPGTPDLDLDTVLLRLAR